jgi:hypothetical protein
MKMTVLGVVTRGLPSGARPCDLCGARNRPLTEANIRYWALTTHQSHGFWYDGCPECIVRLSVLPDLPVEAGRARLAWDRVKEKLRAKR